VATVQPPATGVALTLQAVASETAEALPAPSPTLPVPPLLPRPLYFLDHDTTGHSQIFRLEVDGRTVSQISFEPMSVDSYDVSPKDGRIAYTSNNELFLIDSDGAARQMLLDGGPVDENNRWTHSVGAPVWSRDGEMLAYGYGGLNLLTFGHGEIRRILDNQVDTSPGFPIVHQIYSPDSFSPDGTRLLVNIGFYEGGTYGIYNLADSTLVQLSRADGGTVCCHTSWIPDGTGVYIASPSLGMIESGLFYADAFSGQVSALLPALAPDGTYNFADAAQPGPDGKLYFFFNNLPDIPAAGHTPLFLVRSAADGITGRGILLPGAFQDINEILWSPDAALAVLVIARDPNTYTGGRAEIIYPDGRPLVPLVPSAQNLQWGP
jgi:Tol biopolymer transport system component